MHSSVRYLSQDWPRTQEGREVMMSIMQRNGQQRKLFGLLERPSLPIQTYPDEYQYKIFVSGKSGVGKTSTVAKLSGNIIAASHSETPGIQTTNVFWPAKMMDIGKVVMFNLQFWDAGENALRKFDHVLPACKDQADAVLFLFSFIDKASFNNIPQQMSRILDPDDNVCKIVLGTKFDIHAHSEITYRDLREFETNWQLPVKFIKNTPNSDQSEPKSDYNDVAPLMNYICEQLWMRDQSLAGHSQPSSDEVIV